MIYFNWGFGIAIKNFLIHSQTLEIPIIDNFPEKEKEYNNIEQFLNRQTADSLFELTILSHKDQKTNYAWSLQYLYVPQDFLNQLNTY
ncbi:hypothetical protein AYWB_396 [Aster yellows witches'-broom phytoplasma AYWB]|uniref:Uncharacterized protein n=2 Tax=16SrI (Aster yellows group) TaxID=3042590 RepID=Q2NJ80_AYWBP|nr:MULTISPECIES: hypothetical protein [16SrI (Aster yellows group)]ABC65513.1 hypothetical protein AYWB_396 [Aster yellows witches'-broom phytoplasma AYWB]PEH36280.1 hypothetical protein BBA70_01895 [New Jersey aster yellows phytoplasma]